MRTIWFQIQNFHKFQNFYKCTIWLYFVRSLWNPGKNLLPDKERRIDTCRRRLFVCCWLLENCQCCVFLENTLWKVQYLALWVIFYALFLSSWHVLGSNRMSLCDIWEVSLWGIYSRFLETFFGRNSSLFVGRKIIFLFSFWQY